MGLFRLISCVYRLDIHTPNTSRILLVKASRHFA